MFLVCSAQDLPKAVQGRQNSDRVMGNQGPLMYMDSNGWARVVWSNRSANLAQIAEQGNASSNRKV